MRKVKKNLSQKITRLTRITATLVLFVCIAAAAMHTDIQNTYRTLIQNVQNITQTHTQPNILPIKQITISGLQRLNEKTIKKSISIREGNPITQVNTKHMKRKLEAIDTIETATILRLLPDRIHIDITEREPFAIWQAEGKKQESDQPRFYVIDKNGVKLTSLNPLNWTHLPHVVGKGGNKTIRQLTTHIRAIWPQLAQMNPIARRVDDRRWTLYTDGNITVLLPETNAPAALQKLKNLNQKYQILEREIAYIDMRLNDRIIISPTRIRIQPENTKKNTQQHIKSAYQPYPHQ